MNDGEPEADAGDARRARDLLDVARERGRRDALERLARYSTPELRRHVALSMLVATVLSVNDQRPENDAARGYVSGVVEVAERELRSDGRRPGGNDDAGGPYARDKGRDPE